jgi:hypothetical protein
MDAIANGQNVLQEKQPALANRTVAIVDTITLRVSAVGFMTSGGTLIKAIAAR